VHAAAGVAEVAGEAAEAVAGEAIERTAYLALRQLLCRCYLVQKEYIYLDNIKLERTLSNMGWTECLCLHSQCKADPKLDHVHRIDMTLGNRILNCSNDFTSLLHVSQIREMYGKLTGTSIRSRLPVLLTKVSFQITDQCLVVVRAFSKRRYILLNT